MLGRHSKSQVNSGGDSFSAVPHSVPQGSKWPARLREFSVELRSSRDDRSRNETRGKVWEILNGAVCLYLRVHSTRLGQVGNEDREDLAAEKSLELLRRIESGKTDFSGRSPGEIASFLSKVARNELLDFLRKEGRRVDLGEQDVAEWEGPGLDRGGTTAAATPPDVLVERKEFAEALRRCVGLLESRLRLAWFFRVFYGMPSKDIAVHPRIRVRVGNVDVMLQRGREAVRDCVRRAGFNPKEMPPGTFVELWKTLRFEGA